MTPLTQAYADFAATASALAPPDEALHTATTGFVDAIGVMLAGAREPVVDVLARWAAAQGGAEADEERLQGGQRQGGGGDQAHFKDALQGPARAR